LNVTNCSNQTHTNNIHSIRTHLLLLHMTLSAVVVPVARDLKREDATSLDPNLLRAADIATEKETTFHTTESGKPNRANQAIYSG
jgi:hypothetical protein